MNVRLPVRSLIVLVAGLLLWHAEARSVRLRQAAPEAALALSASADDLAALPPGLSLPGDDPSVHDAVRLVAADIDDDGDLDVVANDGSLRLTVWENDGAGHLTRKRPQHDSGWQADMPGPSWDTDGAATLFWVQNDSASIDHDLAAAIAALEPSGAWPHPSPAAARRSLADSRLSRAPPVRA